MTVQADILKAIEGIEHGFQQAGQALSERIFHCRQVHGAEIVDARSLSESDGMPPTAFSAKGRWRSRWSPRTACRFS